MKPLIAIGLALACASFLASALLAAPSAIGTDNSSRLPSARQMNSANYALDWSAVGEISGGASTSASYHLDSTIGQMAVNSSSASAGYGLCTGFECVLNLIRTYLPVIRR